MVTYTEVSRKRERTDSDSELDPVTLRKIQKVGSEEPETESKDAPIILSRSQSVLSVTDLKEPLAIQSHPVPEISPNEILVHNRAIGLNPIDWKGKKYGFGIYHFPWINGRESSGKVVHVGSEVKNVKAGDDVIVSSTSYRDNRTSTFQEYTAIDSRLVWKLPKSLTYEEGATIGVGLVTAGIIFYNSFGFQLSEIPEQADGYLLIWGGATVVGIYLTQLAKLYGLKVISIASLDHKDYLVSLGADHVINRHLTEAQIVAKIKSIVGEEGIKYGVDCVSKQTSTIVLDILDQTKSSLSTEPAQFAGIVGVPKEHPESVEIKEVVIKRFHEDLKFGEQFITATSHFLNKRLIKPVRYRHYKGGLHIIDNALKDLENKGAKGEKYVVSI
ncbi:quinone oxidoreductase [Spathaspora passalidarum NRRL Y-27907]|uniref:Quinone oxidoreductase n=1 Tax=Spathaspora passalidarum (strain NRRL Y-27907 / 11-Y1) TaxID=619300 RepID=G3AQ58_SPAPN|nr:quinone oxidoreductase [Spathaspora passalidarum NRRL Y-27907]EGW31404.1 quinone oxidoreductase [Spathaspora passalidarum NRRL Y-27907]